VERFAEDGCTIEPEALERLVAAGEGHPRTTMLIARWTHEASIVEGTRKLAEAHVSAGIRAAQLADRPKHEQTLDRIRALGRHAQRLAIRVASGSAIYSGLNSKIANETVRALRDAGIIEQSAPRSWRVSDPLLRDFLLELDSGE